MKSKDLIDLIFTHPHINKKAWLFKADTEDIDIRIDDDDYYWVIWP